MEDIRKDVSEIINERLKSPILGAFIIAWIGWNWEVIVFLIFDANENINTVNYLKKKLLNDSKSTLLYPLLSALLYPVFSFIAFAYNELIEAWKSKVNFIIHERTPIDSDQKFQILQAMSKQKVEYEKLFEDKDIEIEKLQDQIEEYVNGENESIAVLKREKSELTDQIKAYKKELDNFKKENEKNAIDETDHFDDLRATLANEDYVMEFLDQLKVMGDQGKDYKTPQVYAYMPDKLIDFLKKEYLIEVSPVNIQKFRLTEKGVKFIEYHSSQ
ncbi:hypothetical protein [Reichenbachiella sp.]